MIFIKNYAKEILNDEDVELKLKLKDNVSQVSVQIKGETAIDLVKSEVKEINPSLQKCFNKLGKINNYLKVENDETTDCVEMTTRIIPDKFTEVSFFVKGIKTVLKEIDEFPNTIAIYDKEVEKKKHYPRDIIVFIVPNTLEGEEVSVRLIVDRRNIGGKTRKINLGDYSIIVMYAKYPIWGKVKYPTYAYLKVDYPNREDKKPTEMVGFKLGTMKYGGITKNAVLEEDVKIVKDYLEDAFEQLRQKSAKKRNNKINKNKKTNQQHNKKQQSN